VTVVTGCLLAYTYAVRYLKDWLNAISSFDLQIKLCGLDA